MSNKASSHSEADVKLMLFMIASVEGIKTDNEHLAELVGGGCTANGMRQRVHKIKKLAAAALAEGGGADTSAATTGKGTSKTTSGSKRKNGFSDPDLDDTLSMPTRKRGAAERDKPTKGAAKKSARVAKSEKVVKAEVDRDEVDDIMAEEDVGLQVDG